MEVSHFWAVLSAGFGSSLLTFLVMLLVMYRVHNRRILPGEEYVENKRARMVRLLCELQYHKKEEKPDQQLKLILEISAGIDRSAETNLYRPCELDPDRKIFSVLKSAVKSRQGVLERFMEEREKKLMSEAEAEFARCRSFDLGNIQLWRLISSIDRHVDEWRALDSLVR